MLTVCTSWTYCVCVLSHFSHVQLLCNLMDCSLCPWDFLSKNTGVGCHFLLQGIFPLQESNLCVRPLLHGQADSSLLQLSRTRKRNWVTTHGLSALTLYQPWLPRSPSIFCYCFLNSGIPRCCWLFMLWISELPKQEKGAKGILSKEARNLGNRGPERLLTTAGYPTEYNAGQMHYSKCEVIS